MKVGWSHVRLAEVSEKITQGPNPKYDKSTDEAFRVLKTKDLYDAAIYYEKADRVSEAVFLDNLAAELKAGDVLLAIVGQGSINKCNVFESRQEARFIFTRALGLIRPKRSRLDPYFLKYFLQSSHGKGMVDAGIGGTSGQQVVTTTHLKSLEIPLPPLDEQQKIVAVLDDLFDSVDCARANAEANVRNARELFESVKLRALGRAGENCETVVLSDVANISSGLVDPRDDLYADMLHIGAGNMVSGADELVDVKTAREEKLISGKYIFDHRMVLYSKIRPYLRKAARPNFGGLCSADVYPLNPNPDKLNRDFLFHLLLGRHFTDYAISGSDRAGMPKVNREHMFAYTFQLPPLETQLQIAAVIDDAQIACAALYAMFRRKLCELDDLRQSLLQRAFAGELT